MSLFKKKKSVLPKSASHTWGEGRRKAVIIMRQRDSRKPGNLVQLLVSRGDKSETNIGLVRKFGDTGAVPGKCREANVVQIFK